MKTIFKVLAGMLLVLIIGLSVAVNLGPDYAKNYLNENGEELIGRQVYLENVDFEFFELSLSVDSLIIMEINGLDRFIELNELSVDIDFPAIFKSEYIIQSAVISGLKVNIEQDGNAFNFDDIIEHFTSDTSTVNSEPIEEVNDIVKYTLLNFVFEKGEIHYYDMAIDHNIQIKNIQFSLPALAWDNQKAHSDFSLDFPNGGGIDSYWDIDLASKSFDVEVEIKDLYLDFLLPYIQESLNVSDIKGRLSNHFYISGDASDTFDLKMNGVLSLNEFLLKDSIGDPFFGIDSLGITIDSFLLADQFISVNSLKIEEPYFGFKRFKNGTSLGNLVRQDGDTLNKTQIEKTNKDTASSEPWHYLISQVDVGNGRVKYTDYTIDEVFNYHMNEIEVHTGNLSNTNSKLNIEGRQVLADRGEVLTNMTIDMNDPETFEAEVDLKGIWLKDFTPFSLYFIGNEIKTGSMNYFTKVSAVQGQLTSTHSVHIADIKLSNRVNKESVLNMPVGVALAILKDNSGNIGLDYGISGDMNDPSFDPKGLFWNTLGNIVIKTVSSPGNLLGGVLSGDSAAFTDLKYDKFEVILSSKQKNQLKNLKKILDQKSELKLVFIARNLDSLVAQDMAYVDCLFDYYYQQNPKKRRKKAVQKDSLNALQLYNEEGFAQSLGIEFSELTVPKAKQKALAKKGIVNYQAQIDSIHNVRMNNIKAYLTLQLGADRKRVTIGEREAESDSKYVQIGIQLGLKEE